MLIAYATHPDGTSYGHIEAGRFVVATGTPFDRLEPTTVSHPLDAVRLLAPVQPSRVLVILGGYLLDDQPRPPEPKLFPKVVTRHLGPDEIIPRPPVLTGDIVMEAELALVVGRTTTRVTVEEAGESILGYTVYNDVTAAEFVPHDLFRAKSLDSFGVIGPWISTGISDADLASGLEIVGRRNGEVVQRNSTSRYKFTPAEVLSHASQYVTLLPGDVIALGTPPPAPPVSAGDVIEADVEHVGVLRNTIGG